MILTHSMSLDVMSNHTAAIKSTAQVLEKVSNGRSIDGKRFQDHGIRRIVFGVLQWC